MRKGWPVRVLLVGLLMVAAGVWLLVPTAAPAQDPLPLYDAPGRGMGGEW